MEGKCGVHVDGGHCTSVVPSFSPDLDYADQLPIVRSHKGSLLNIVISY